MNMLGFLTLAMVKGGSTRDAFTQKVALSGDPFCSDITDWLQEFRENLVDDRVPEHRHSHSSSSHEASLEPHSREVRIWVGTVSILISIKTEIARCARGPKSQGPCRRRIGRVVPRTENFGDLITADHKVLSDN